MRTLRFTGSTQAGVNSGYMHPGMYGQHAASRSLFSMRVLVVSGLFKQKKRLENAYADAMAACLHLLGSSYILLAELTADAVVSGY